MKARKCGMKNNRRPNTLLVIQGFKSLNGVYLRPGSFLNETAHIDGNTMCSAQILDKHKKLEKPVAALISQDHVRNYTSLCA
jgi:hypothetical protein